MKNNSLTLIAFLIALAAVVVLPVGPAGACTALTLTGVLSVFLADYGRDIEPMRVLA